MVHKKQPISLILVAILLGAGCAVRAVRMTNDVDLSPVKRVAVLPFDNLTDEMNAGERVTHVFISALHQARVVQILELGEVEQFLIRNRIRSTGQIDLGLLRGIGRELGVDAILLGIVDEYGYRSIGGQQIPVVSLSMRLLDTRTGNILLAGSTSHSGVDSETVFGLGRVRSVAQLTDRVTAEVVQSLAKRFPHKMAAEETAAWLPPVEEPVATPDGVIRPQPTPEPTPSPLEQTPLPLSAEEAERERSRESAKKRTQQWYEEILRQRRSKDK